MSGSQRSRDGSAGPESRMPGTRDVTVWVKPGSRKGPLVVEDSVSIEDRRLTVYLRERAVDGKANAALLSVLAAHYGVLRSHVHVLHGHASRMKRVRIEGQ